MQFLENNALREYFVTFNFKVIVTSMFPMLVSTYDIFEM